VNTRKCERLVGGLGFGEAPRWRDGKLWLSDMETGFVHTVTPDGHIDTIVQVPGYPSGIGWLPDGTPLVVSMEQRCIFAIGSEGLILYQDLSHLVPGDCNDLVVDETGRGYVGNVGFDHKKVPFQPRPTQLVLLVDSQEPRFVGSEVLIPNGAVISPDRQTLIVAETIANRLSAFTISEDGSLVDHRIFAQLPDCLPDGICLDAEGCVWVADSATTHCVRVRPDGQVVDILDAGRPCYACMLGGESGSTLFVMTADGHDDQSKARRTASVECAEVDAPGAGWP
jgi:sugar lactone lactonase YvrE